MKRLLLSFCRLAIMSSAALGIATAANIINYRSYWENAVNSVKTVDFNKLSHSIPAQLSQAFIEADEAEINRILNENYGFWGLVLTNCATAEANCPDQSVIYTSENRQTWLQKEDVTRLENYPYELLRKPPLLLAGQAGDRAKTDYSALALEGQNIGSVLGRVYYIQGTPPAFVDDYLAWLKNPLSDRGSHRSYALMAIALLNAGIAAWLVVEWLIYRKRTQTQQALAEAQTLRQQLQDKLQQTPKLLAELERYRAEQKRLRQRLDKTIAQYETQLTQKELKQAQNVEALRSLQDTLETAQQQAHANARGQELLREQERLIHDLQSQIETQHREQQRTESDLVRLRSDLQTTRQQATDASKCVQDLDRSIAKITQERDSAAQKARDLEQQLEAVQRKVARSRNLTEALEAARAEVAQIKAQAKDFEQYALQENTHLTTELERLKHQQEDLESDRYQLEQERDDLLLQVWELQDEVAQWTDYVNSQATDFGKSEIQPQRPSEPAELPRIDLSSISLAIVGGHATTRREVIKTLTTDYGLHQYVEIATFKEENTNLNKVKARIKDSDLIVVITGFMSHKMTNILSELQRDSVLSGELLMLNCRGKSGVIREILTYFSGSSRTGTSG